ncbi:MAG: flavin reductase family protein [Lentisphaerae bacterium]|nr:flavin reductase family protein [Lentisphaerota bacterium]
MSKVKIDNNAFTYFMPMALVGAMVDNRPNFLAVAWLTRVNYKPPLMAVALGKTHFTNPGLRATKAFSVNIPGVDLAEKTDYCGLVSGKKVDKSKLFTVFTGETGAPMIEECRLCLDCRLIQTVDLPADELFIGEIVGAYADETCLTDGKPDVKKIDPFTLTMPDNGYWRVGEYVGKAWSLGKNAKA